jgi:hypothetical protein
MPQEKCFFAIYEASRCNFEKKIVVQVLQNDTIKNRLLTDPLSDLGLGYCVSFMYMKKNNECLNQT